MKKKLTITFFALLMAAGAFSQHRENEQLTMEIKLAELLQKWPYQNPLDIDKLIIQLDAMGEPAILEIASGITAPGMEEDSVFRYALSGLVKYYSDGNDPDNMKKVSLVICQAIENSEDEEAINFIFQELQYIAGDEVVPVISKYLLNERLCEPAARILVRVGSEQAGKMLDETLLKAETTQQGIIIAAIGQLRYAPSANKILSLAGTSGKEQKKIIMRALAEMGDLESANLLSSEAKKAGYTFEYTDATSSYLLYLKRTAENGNYTFASKSLKKIRNTKKIPEHTRFAVLWTEGELKK